MKKILPAYVLLLISVCVFPNLQAQSNEELRDQIEKLNGQIQNMEHTFDVLTKKIDDVLWMQKLEDVDPDKKYPLIVLPNIVKVQDMERATMKK